MIQLFAAKGGIDKDDVEFVACLVKPVLCGTGMQMEMFG